jgi:predicted RNase H-like HicB family nuclease
MLTAILTREDGGFVALCPEVDVASQGATVEEAKANLKEAVELFFECASEDEVQQRMTTESFISTMEVQLA